MDEFKKAYKNLVLKFTSGNDIPVSRAVITREEWDAINEENSRLTSEIEDWKLNAQRLVAAGDRITEEIAGLRKQLAEKEAFSADTWDGNKWVRAKKSDTCTWKKLRYSDSYGRS